MKILLAVDDSECSEAAIRSFRERPWPQGTTARVLSVSEPVVPSAAELLLEGHGDPAVAMEARRQYTEHFARRVAESLQGVNTEIAVREGDPRDIIVDEAKNWPADLIIVGSHGRKGIRRWLLGSVAQTVVTHAPCSVEVIRCPGDHS